jgi:hypothetical protein
LTVGRLWAPTMMLHLAETAGEVKASKHLLLLFGVNLVGFERLKVYYSFLASQAMVALKVLLALPPIRPGLARPRVCWQRGRSWSSRGHAPRRGASAPRFDPLWSRLGEPLAAPPGGGGHFLAVASFRRARRALAGMSATL